MGKAIAAVWHALAAVIGGTARAAGRNAATARDLPPEHRRDGAALGVLAFGLISMMAIWFHAAGPVGRAIDTAARALGGNGALLLPLVLLLAGGHMLRQAPEPEARGRLFVGSFAIAISVLGQLDIWGDSPSDAAGRAHAGGIVGTGIGQPLSAGLSAVVAVPVLTVVGAFGILVVTATPISVLVGYLRSLLGFGADGVEDEVVDEAPAKPRRRRPKLEADAEASTSEIVPPDDALAGDAGSPGRR